MSPWLPPDFVHPERVELSTGHHLRPIRESDTAIDYPAVMASQERLWQIFGPAWQWPPADMTYEQDRVDLARHEREIAAHESFNYAVLDAAESELFGCVYIDPPEQTDADAEISWWVVDGMVGAPLEAELSRTIPEWINAKWPFRNPRFSGVARG
ncbi:MAG TPA: GNAT family N-acetyltransferase [Jatrophihabitantaceae bacterium]